MKVNDMERSPMVSAQSDEPHEADVSAPTGGRLECARKIERCIAYMLQHINQPLQVAALASQANVSPSHFFALFKRQTGSAPIDYFIRLRMRRARALLDNTTMSVKEIAAELGYSDPFYFSRLFKSVNRLAPSEYRMLRREVNGTASTQSRLPEFFQPPELPEMNRRARLAVMGCAVAEKYQFA